MICHFKQLSKQGQELEISSMFRMHWKNNNLNFNNLRKDYWTQENLPVTSAQPSNMGTYQTRQDHGEMQNRKCHIRCFSSNFP